MTNGILLKKKGRKQRRKESNRNGRSRLSLKCKVRVKFGKREISERRRPAIRLGVVAASTGVSLRRRISCGDGRRRQRRRAAGIFAGGRNAAAAVPRRLPRLRQRHVPRPTVGTVDGGRIRQIRRRHPTPQAALRRHLRSLLPQERYNHIGRFFYWLLTANRLID